MVMRDVVTRFIVLHHGQVLQLEKWVSDCFRNVCSPPLTLPLVMDSDSGEGSPPKSRKLEEHQQQQQQQQQQPAVVTTSQANQGTPCEVPRQPPQPRRRPRKQQAPQECRILEQQRPQSRDDSPLVDNHVLTTTTTTTTTPVISLPISVPSIAYGLNQRGLVSTEQQRQRQASASSRQQPPPPPQPQQWKQQANQPSVGVARNSVGTERENARGAKVSDKLAFVFFHSCDETAVGGGRC